MEEVTALTFVGVIKEILDIILLEEDESSSDSDEELQENITFIKMKVRVAAERVPPHRIPNYNLVISSYTGSQFQAHFRLSREAFQYLLNRTGPHLINTSVTGRNTVEPQKRLLAIVWLLATPESYRSVGDRFDLGKSSLFHCFVRVIRVLNQLAPDIIRWPTDNYLEVVKAKFAAMRGIRNIVGIVDGTYVKIKAPVEDAENYINRKCFYGITLQAICDHRLKITNAFVGFPSAVSDVRIFRNSHIYANFINHNNEYFPNGEFILGDKAYPITPWCIPPYIERRPLTNIQRYFNLRHAQTRQCIERTFALYFGRFRRMRDLDMSRTDLIPATILARCVLHNICLDYRDDFIDQYIGEGEPAVVNQEQEHLEDGQIVERDEEGIHKRNLIAQNLFARRNQLHV